MHSGILQGMFVYLHNSLDNANHENTLVNDDLDKLFDYHFNLFIWKVISIKEDVYILLLTYFIIFTVAAFPKMALI